MNKLLVDTQTYCTISSKLSALSSKLESLSAQLSSIDLSQEAGSTVQLTLSSIRFSLIGTSLADEIAGLAIKRVARAAKSTASEAAALRLRILSAVDMLESSEQELVAQISDLCTDASEWEKRQGGAGAASTLSATSSWSQDDLAEAIKWFNAVENPDDIPCIQSAESIRDDKTYQFLEGAYSAITGDWSNMAQSDATREQYLFNALLQSCADPDFTPWSAEAALHSDDDELTDIIWNYFLGEDFESFGTNPGADPTTVGMKEALNCINKLRLINSMDKSVALSMAEAYMRSGDESMQNAGQYLYKYLTSDIATQAAMLIEDKLISYANDKVQSNVYEMVTEAIPVEITATISATKEGLDFSMNTSDNASLTNNFIYAAEAARTMYDTFQSDYAAYQANPTDANLERAMSSYSAYQLTLSNVHTANADYLSNTEDSLAGKLLPSKSAQTAIEVSKNLASSHYWSAQTMNDLCAARTT